MAQGVFENKEIKSTNDLSLIFTAKQEFGIFKKSKQAKKYFYIFNCTDSKGFVIVSADDIVVPILGYSINNSFEVTQMPDNLEWWLQNYCEQIQFALDDNLLPTDENKGKWIYLQNGLNLKLNSKSNVGPLLQTEWDQSPYYNDLCPDNNTGIHAVTGCCATAMAQIMKFWNYPSTGTSSHSYSDPLNYDQNNNPISGSSYGLQTVNFGTTTYNWSAMPNSLTSTNNAVAALMYHCGVSVEMNYSVGGSGAWVLTNDQAGNHPASAEHAYTTYFGYNSSTLQGKRRSNYPVDADWIALLKNELDNSRPIQYAGWNSANTSAHTWVCDGYDQNDYFHMNWGWSGNHDDYFTIDLTNESGTSILPYKYFEQVLIGIEPNGGSCIYTLSANSNTFSSSGGPGSFNINTSTNCGWTAISNNPSWIHVSTPSGTGSGSVSYTVDANTSSGTLIGTITIIGLTSNLTYTIYETGLNCSYNLIPQYSTPFSSTGGTGTFSLTTNSSCQWSAYSNDPSWLHITSSTSGTGNNSISYYVDPNLTTNSLIGTISVADQVFTVTENGNSINCEVSIP
ncbi:MAG: C10 family peptidase, partial [Bacteroidota bacterium]